MSWYPRPAEHITLPPGDLNGACHSPHSHHLNRRVKQPNSESMVSRHLAFHVHQLAPDDRDREVEPIE